MFLPLAKLINWFVCSFVRSFIRVSQKYIFHARKKLGFVVRVAWLYISLTSWDSKNMMDDDIFRSFRLRKHLTSAFTCLRKTFVKMAIFGVFGNSVQIDARSVK